MNRTRQVLLLVVFTLVLLAMGELAGVREQASLAHLRTALHAHLLPGLALFVVLFALGNLMHVPGLVFLAAAVLTLGRTWGGLATYVAACTSCAVTFFTVRWVGGDALRGLDNRLARRLFAHLDDRPVLSVVLLRMVFQSLPALNFSLALSGLGFRRYLAGTLLGLPLPIALFCVFFERLEQALHLS